MDAYERIRHRDDCFRQFVRMVEGGRKPDLEAHLRAFPEEVHADVRSMIIELGELAPAAFLDVLQPEAGVIVDEFVLISPLGSGGSGSVWLAEEPATSRRVAVKFLRPELVLSRVAVCCFEREAATAQRLQHPGIVKAYAHGAWEGQPYIVLELVDGPGTLADWFEARRATNPRSIDHFREIAVLFHDIAAALTHAHAAGVVHRDIKPTNILVDGSGLPKVTDFGAALIQDDPMSARAVDRLGTPFYMSPEQAAAPCMALDHRTDVFSLGATLYEALSMRRAFEGDTIVQVCTKILTVEPPDPRELRPWVPGDLAVICMKALVKNPDGRYSQMALLRDDLRAFLDNRKVLSLPQRIRVALSGAFGSVHLKRRRPRPPAPDDHQWWPRRAA